MCGRYGESKILEQVKGKVPFFRAESALKPRYNIAPTQMAPVIVNQGDVVLKDMRWGLIAFWAKDEDIGNRVINARAETVKEKPSFRNSLKRKRCLVFVDGGVKLVENRRFEIPLVLDRSGQQKNRQGELSACRIGLG